jgi:hypothetical protein
MIDFIVAKALAKMQHDRYSSAGQLADDLRECRTQIKPVPGLSSSFAAAKQPAFSTVDVEAATQLMEQSWQMTRQADAEHATIDITATLGLSKIFDSAAATQRLAVQTGAADEPQDGAKTQMAQVAETGVYGTVVSGPFSRQIAPSFGIRSQAWSRRDWLMFFTSVGVATLLAALIVLH